MPLHPGHPVRSRALLCAAGLWLVGVVLCAGGVTSDAHPSGPDAAPAGQAHHGERGHGHDNHDDPSENCCEDIRAFPVSEFQSLAIATPPPAVALYFLAWGELSSWHAVQSRHALDHAQSRGPPRTRGFAEILLRKSIPGRAPPSAA